MQTICCLSTGVNTNQYCQAPGQPYVINGQIQFCSAQNQFCQSGYTCSVYLGRYVCCSTQNSNIGTCPAGTTAYINPGTGTVLICNSGGFCPTGYTCRLSGNVYLCCTTSATTACPAGTTAYTNPGTGLTVSCTVSTTNVCPSGYTCNTQVGICCSGSGGGPNQMFYYYCPTGMLPYTSTSTGLPQSCTSGNAASCPASYTCQVSIIL